MKIHNAPTFEQWRESSNRFFCDVKIVLRHTETVQTLKNCVFSYGLCTKMPLILNGWWPVETDDFIADVLDVWVKNSDKRDGDLWND